MTLSEHFQNFIGFLDRDGFVFGKEWNQTAQRPTEKIIEDSIHVTTRIHLFRDDGVVFISLAVSLMTDESFLLEDTHDGRNSIVSRFRLGHRFQQIVDHRGPFDPEQLHDFQLGPGQFLRSEFRIFRSFHNYNFS